MHLGYFFSLSTELSQILHLQRARSQFLLLEHRDKATALAGRRSMADDGWPEVRDPQVRLCGLSVLYLSTLGHVGKFMQKPLCHA